MTICPRGHLAIGAHPLAGSGGGGLGSPVLLPCSAAYGANEDQAVLLHYLWAFLGGHEDRLHWFSAYVEIRAQMYGHTNVTSVLWHVA